MSSAAELLARRRNEHILRPPTFNIFQALGHAYREVSTHSAMLAHLLDPHASHAQGGLFLDAFLQCVKSAARSQGLNALMQGAVSVGADHYQRG